MSKIAPISNATMLALASTALGKVDLHGHRGVTMVSTAEIEAMALLLAALGLVPTRPGEPAPPAFFLTPEGAVK